jgi:Na+/glutamate symporter
MSTWLRTILKSGLYLAAILLVPGALIGVPLLWWLGQRRRTSPQANEQAKGIRALCAHC